ARYSSVRPLAWFTVFWPPRIPKQQRNRGGDEQRFGRRRYLWWHDCLLSYSAIDLHGNGRPNNKHLVASLSYRPGPDAAEFCTDSGSFDRVDAVDISDTAIKLRNYSAMVRKCHVGVSSCRVCREH